MLKQNFLSYLYCNLDVTEEAIQMIIGRNHDLSSITHVSDSLPKVKKNLK